MAGTITSLGIGSGIDIENIVTQLVAAERRPIQLLETRQTEIDIQVSALGLIRDSVSKFQTGISDLKLSSGFRSFSVTSSDDQIITASVGEGSVPIASDIEVLSLAQKNKLASSAFANGDSIVGNGQLDISVGVATFSISINDNNNTLIGIRDAINDNFDNTGVSASIITADDGSHLVLTSEESGTENVLSVTVIGDSDGNDTDAAGLSNLVFVAGGTENLQEIDIAQDATLTVDGFDVTRSSNEISDVIEGVTLSLKDIGTAALSVTEDRSVGKNAIETAVTAYNDLIISLNTQRESTLQGESLLLGIETRVRQIFTNRLNVTGSDFNYLFDVGLTFDRDGILSLDDEKFDQAIEDDFNGVVQLFSNPDDGFAQSIDSILSSYVETGGLIQARTDGLSDSRSQIDDNIARIENRIVLTEKRLRSQYAALDSLVGQLNATSNFLTQQLANLPTNSLINSRN
ncbi:MAG: flagellar filament capping protein FliD [Gammaproteobacteria bacterium]|nr:MAG: flagellar filament capping protein FliD [Gammaproteobacteria bacterium]